MITLIMGVLGGFLSGFIADDRGYKVSQVMYWVICVPIIILFIAAGITLESL